MPTGYTAMIGDKKGVTFKEFALNCARAFGACIEMRDDPMDKPIPEKFEANSYHLAELREAEKRLEKLELMGRKELEKNAEIEYKKELKSHEEYLKQKRELKEKYEAMLAEAKAWVPPTPDHIELKNFMVQQITQSIDFDCSTSYSKSPIKMTGEQWLVKERKSIEWDIQYHRNGHDKDIERATSRTEWITQLRQSLK